MARINKDPRCLRAEGEILSFIMMNKNIYKRATLDALCGAMGGISVQGRPVPEHRLYSTIETLSSLPVFDSKHIASAADALISDDAPVESYKELMEEIREFLRVDVKGLNIAYVEDYLGIKRRRLVNFVQTSMNLDSSEVLALYEFLSKLPVLKTKSLSKEDMDFLKSISK